MTERTHGPVETAYRAWIATLGQLSERQTAEAEHLYALSAEMDLIGSSPAAAKASISRAIARTADRLRDEKNTRPAASTPDGGNVVPQTAVEQARAARAQRQGGTA